MPDSIDDIPVEGREADPALVREIADLVVSALNLEVEADQIDPAAPLYGAGLGLDSIDILEVALVASKRYGFKLKDEDRDNVGIFSSLNHLALHVAARRTK
jgi:acyl carrier protein